MRQIVFASGKGGTGKTTLAALGAHLAAVTDGITLADCDVEAANLPIALKARITRRDPFAGGAKAVIDAEVCRGCGACLAACRFSALAAGDDFFRNRSFVVDPWACEGCGACVPKCLDGAIRMEPSRAGEVFSAETVVGPMAFGQLLPGEDLSGKLVTEVRARARELAESRRSELMLIDGPPGVGCPAIASITNADLLVAVTEPTVSGEHDLVRLVALARRLGVRTAVVLNKADLSAAGASRIRDRVAAEGLELLGEVPFDPALADLLAGLAEGADATAAAGPGLDAVRAVWQAVREIVLVVAPTGNHK
ncbi:MAG: ATP-binding protein [Coriobacteriia bacterium]|nr:ATP-binding protein [Coriobacteriia bacterium]